VQSRLEAHEELGHAHLQLLRQEVDANLGQEQQLLLVQAAHLLLLLREPLRPPVIRRVARRLRRHLEQILLSAEGWWGRVQG